MRRYPRAPAQDKILPLALFGSLIVALYLLLSGPLAGQELPAPPPRSCYLLEELLGPPTPLSGEEHRFPWVLCPRDSLRDAVTESRIRPALREVLEDETTPPAVRARLERWIRISGLSLDHLTCWAVGEIRLGSSAWLPAGGVDPDDDRDRSAEEIALWVARTAEAHGAPEAVAVAEVLEGWPADGLKRAHDLIKPVASELCPRR